MIFDRLRMIFDRLRDGRPISPWLDMALSKVKLLSEHWDRYPYSKENRRINGPGHDELAATRVVRNAKTTHCNKQNASVPRQVNNSSPRLH